MKSSLIVDGRMLIGDWRFRGISKYIRSIVRNKEILFLSPKTKIENYLPTDRSLMFGFKTYFLWEQISLPLKLLFIPYKYALFPSTTAPVFINRRKSVFVVYDLIFLKKVNNKTLMQKLSSLYRRKISSINIRRVDNIICISNFTKNEIIKYYELKPSQSITVIHCSLEDKWFVSKKSKIKSDKYFLSVTGSLESKNFKRVLEAFQQFNTLVGDLYKLKVIGLSGGKHKDFRHKLEKLNLLENVVFISNIDDEQLITLYDNAKLSLTLSTHEGFGFPVVEAMARKTPVLISNQSSLPEVGGPNAMYANPYDINDISSKMSAFHNMGQNEINHMIEKNYSYSQQFNEKILSKKADLFWKKLEAKN